MHPDPLPALREGQPKEVVRFRRAALPARAADVQARIDAEKRSDSLIVVGTTLSEAHPLVAKTQESLATAKEDTCGLLAGGELGGLDLKAGKGSLERALRIMDALLKALDRRGFPVSVDEKKRTTATVLGEPVAFALEELVDRTERPLTPAQEKDKVRNPWKYARPEYDYSPSDRLSIKITDPSWGEIGRCSWSDGKRQRIESILNAFIAALIQAASVEREHRIQHEKWAREQAERESAGARNGRGGNRRKNGSFGPCLRMPSAGRKAARSAPMSRRSRRTPSGPSAVSSRAAPWRSGSGGPDNRPTGWIRWPRFPAAPGRTATMSPRLTKALPSLLRILTYPGSDCWLAPTTLIAPQTFGRTGRSGGNS